MAFENGFYTLAFIKAFAKSAADYADRESALLWKIASEFSEQEAECYYDRLNEEAARIAACGDFPEKVFCGG